MNSPNNKTPVTFWSSVEYGGIITGLIEGLREGGFEASQKFQISSQSYRSKRGRIGRLGLRLRMYGFYPIQLAWTQLVHRKPGIDVVCTNTFYAPLIAAVLRPRSRRVVHLVYDLYPDAFVFGTQSDVIKKVAT